MNYLKRFIKDEGGDVFVEASVLFPIIIMIFAAVFFLSVYLPKQARLNELAQYAVSAFTTQKSDTWIYYDEENAEYKNYYNDGSNSTPPNVYVELFSMLADATLWREENENKYTERTETLIGKLATNTDIEVECHVIDFVVYQELQIKLTEKKELPVDLSFIGFSKTLTLNSSARGTVQNGDEFVRNVDIAKDLMTYAAKKLGIADALEGSKFMEYLGKVRDFFEL